MSDDVQHTGRNLPVSLDEKERRRQELTQPRRERRKLTPAEREQKRQKRALGREERKRKQRKQLAALGREPEYVSVAIAEATFGISAWCIRDLIRRGLVDAKRYGARRLLPSYQSLKDHIEGLPDAKTTRPSPAE
jgi:hypothetical protein